MSEHGQYAYVLRQRGFLLHPGTEPDIYDLVVSDRSGSGMEVNPEGMKKVTRLYNARDRIQARFNRDMRKRGKNCTICGKHFQPSRVDQVRCPECIRRIRQAGGS